MYIIYIYIYIGLHIYIYMYIYTHIYIGLLTGLTKALRDKMKKDSIIITTDYELGEGFSLLSTMEGDNPGGECTCTWVTHALCPVLFRD